MKALRKLEGQPGSPPAVMFLDQAGLSVQLHSSKFDYEQFEIWGKEYIRENVTDAAFQAEEENKAFVNISAVQQATKRMLEKGLVKREDIDIPDLTRMLDSPATLAIGKTLMPWLSGIYANGPAHYVVIIKSYNPTLWRIHDPGPPSEAYRKVVKRIGGKPIFEEVLVIRGK